MSGVLDRRSFLSGVAAAGVGVARARRRPIRRPPPRTLEQAIRGPVLRPGQRGFANAAHVYNMRFDGILPEAVARPLDAADVAATVRFTAAHGTEVRARSGGHSYAGYSTLEHGIVLDLRRLNTITVNRAAGTATVGAGAQLIDVYAALAAHGATIPAGSCPSVGVAGVTLGGGVGLAGRAFGLTTDHLIAAQIVTADGRLRAVDRRSDPDLLWALRGGGGGNFGVVTALTFSLRALPASAAPFFVSFPWDAASEALAAWIGWAPHADPRLTSIFHLTAAAGATGAQVTGQFLGNEALLAPLLAPLRAVPGAVIATGEQPYLPLQLLWAGCLHLSQAACHTVGAATGGQLPRDSFTAASDYLSRPLPTAATAILTGALERRASQPGHAAILFDAYGGAINRVAPDATAFVHRDMLCCLQYLSYEAEPGWPAGVSRAMRPYASGQAYQNYIDVSRPNWPSAYYGANYARLREVRRAVDPDRYFRFAQAID